MSREPRPIDLFGFGTAAVDEVVELEAFPKPDSKMPVLNVSRSGGGQCATALVAAARLGLRCCYAGLLGGNELSDFTRRVLDREGIQLLTEVPYPDAQPYFSIILADRSTGERTILFSRAGVREPGSEDLRTDLLVQSKALFIDQLGPACSLRACRLARARGIPVIADLERIDSPDLCEIVTLTDHLILCLRAGQELTGLSVPADVLLELAATPRPCTALTDGARGCWFVQGGDGAVSHQPAFQVHTVDTTGCGDVFHGAYAAGILQGLPVPAAIRFASGASAIKATRPGGQAGIPDRETLERFLRQQPS